MQKSGVTGKNSADLWHDIYPCFYVWIISVSAVWRGRLMSFTVSLWHVRFAVFCSPKPWWWLTSMWNPECPTVWNLWWSKYHDHTDFLIVG
jgi:hypothetical protein